MNPSRFARTALLALLVAASGRAQSIDALRESLRQNLASVSFADAFGGLMILSDDLEVGGVGIRFDGEIDTRLSSIAIPFRSIKPFAEGSALGLYLEGAIGYASARQSVDDLYGGVAPGIQTSAKTEWTTLGGLGGIGVQFPVFESVTLTPIVNGGLAYIENSTHYAGPGAAVSSTLLDGFIFNWNGQSYTAGVALRLDWQTQVGRDTRLDVVLRHDTRWIDTFHAEDPIQDFSERFDFLTLRGELSGPLHRQLFGRDLYWRTNAAYRRFFTGNLYDASDIYLIGGGLEMDVTGLAPAVRRVALSAAVTLGEDLSGYTIGFGLNF